MLMFFKFLKWKQKRHRNNKIKFDNIFSGFFGYDMIQHKIENNNPFSEYEYDLYFYYII